MVSPHWPGPGSTPHQGHTKISVRVRQERSRVRVTCQAGHPGSSASRRSGSKRPATSTNSIRAGTCPRFSHAWSVPRWTTRSPGCSSRSSPPSRTSVIVPVVDALGAVHRRADAGRHVDDANPAPVARRAERLLTRHRLGGLTKRDRRRRCSGHPHVVKRGAVGDRHRGRRRAVRRDHPATATVVGGDHAAGQPGLTHASGPSVVRRRGNGTKAACFPSGSRGRRSAGRARRR